LAPQSPLPHLRAAPLSGAAQAAGDFPVRHSPLPVRRAGSPRDRPLRRTAAAGGAGRRGGGGPGVRRPAGGGHVARGLPRRLAPPARAGSGRLPLDPQSRTYALRRRRRPGGERKSRGSAGEAGPGKGFLLLMKLTKICCLGGRRRSESTRLNSSRVKISYAVFCLIKKTNRKLFS